MKTSNAIAAIILAGALAISAMVNFSQPEVIEGTPSPAPVVCEWDQPCWDYLADPNFTG